MLLFFHMLRYKAQMEFFLVLSKNVHLYDGRVTGNERINFGRQHRVITQACLVAGIIS